jgi:exosortase/archaeosortase family protein
MHETGGVPPRTAGDIGFAILIWLITAALFWPATKWLAAQTLRSEQLLNAFAVLVFAGIVLMREHPHPFVLSFGKQSRRDLTVAYVLMAAAVIFGQSALALLAYCFALSAGAFFVFGSGIARKVYSLLAAFAAFLFFAISLPVFDWPLRRMAGSMAEWLLNLVGQETRLGILAKGEPKLLLAVNGHVFEVAPECNGFGLISGAAMLAVLLVLYRRIAIFDKILCFGIAVLIGFFFNSLRILVICLLAPRVPDHYDLMHETAGLLAYFGGLILIWWIIHGMPGQKTPQA